MKKRNTVLIISAVVVAVLTGIMIAVLQIPENEVVVNSPDTTNILIYDKTKLKADEITVKNSTGEYQLLGYDYTKLAEELSKENEENNEGSAESSQSSRNLITQQTSVLSINTRYTMQGLEDFELDKDLTNEISYDCMYSAALQLVDKTGSKYKEYGLDKPAVTVNIVFSDNSEETLYFGNKAPTDAGYYFRREGDANAYLVSYEYTAPFLKSRYDYLSKIITKDYEDDSSKPEEEQLKFTAVSISGSKFEKPINVTREDDTVVQSEYTMTSPYRVPASSQTVNSFSKMLYGLSGEKVVFAGDADEVKNGRSKFGLDKPYLNISVNVSDSSSVKLLLSEADNKGMVYITPEGGDRIFTINKSDIQKVYDIKCDDFLTAYFISPKTDNMSAAEITVGGETSKFKLTHDIKENDAFEEYINHYAELNGSPIKYENFVAFISNLSKIKRDDIDEESTEGAEMMLKTVFSYKGQDGKEEKEELELMKSSSGKCIVILNGSVMGHTDAAYVEKLMEQSGKINSDQRLSQLSLDEENSEEATSESTEESAE